MSVADKINMCGTRLLEQTLQPATWSGAAYNWSAPERTSEDLCGCSGAALSITNWTTYSSPRVMLTRWLPDNIWISRPQKPNYFVILAQSRWQGQALKPKPGEESGAWGRQTNQHVDLESAQTGTDRWSGFSRFATTFAFAGPVCHLSQWEPDISGPGLPGQILGTGNIRFR